LAAAHAAAHDPAALPDRVGPLLERHREVARRLLAPDAATAFQAELEHARATLADLFRRIAQTPDARPALRDESVAFGEQLAATLLTAVLAARGLPARYVDARRCIVTDETHDGAVPLMPNTERQARDELAPLLEQGALPVLGGFIAAARSGAPTTLGRGGSDYSAALIGA